MSIRNVAPRARDFTNQRYRWAIQIDEKTEAVNSTKGRIRCRVDPCATSSRRMFGFQKIRYRGLSKNLHRLEVTAAVTNLLLARMSLLHELAQRPCR
jgi:IS5 family transposase